MGRVHGIVPAMKGWLARVRHDLLKPVLWTAHDLREFSPSATLGDAELVLLRRGLTDLRDHEGAGVSALELWAHLVQDAQGVSVQALGDFEAALRAAVTAVAGTDATQALAAVLHLEDAFASLATSCGVR